MSDERASWNHVLDGCAGLDKSWARHGSAAKSVRKFALNILPKRLPVILKIPNVLTLEEGNLVTALAIEKIEYRARVWFHCDSLLSEVDSLT
jgi:hypothetical protein